MTQPARPRMSALIVDDEVLARRVLRDLIETLDDFGIAGECRDGAEALASIARLRPDVVFLDMQMPGVDGIALVRAIAALDLPRRPALVFVTAHDRYAIGAFDADAIDYLLKPFTDARFMETIARVRRHFDRERPTPNADTRAARILVSSGGRSILVAVESIDWVSADGYYARLHVGRTSYLLRASLGALEQRLGADRFVRAHRGALVPVERVREVRRSARRCEIILDTGARIAVSERRRAEVVRRLA